MKIKLIILFCLFGFAELFAQTYQRDGKGIKFIQLEGCVRTDNGNTCDSCFVITNGVNGKLNRCLHISQLRSLLLGGAGSSDSTYLVDNADGSYSLFNENGMEYQFGYQLDVSNTGDTLFLLDLDGHVASYLLQSDFDNQTLSWNPATKELGISNGNTVVLTGLGVDSIKLSLSGNQMEMKVNTLTDTSLVIGQNQIQLSGDVLTSIVNGVVDTAELNSLNDGNGIYGGWGVVPDGTYARVGSDSTFYLGWFPDLPGGINNSDRGIIVGDDNNGVSIYGAQKPSGRYGFGRVYCDGATLKIADPFRGTNSNINIGEGYNSWSVNVPGYGSYITMDSVIMEINAYSQLNLYSRDSLRLNTAGLIIEPDAINRGNNGQVLTNVNGFAVWANSCCDTLGGGVDSIQLELSGNTLTMEVNNLTDTSLVIGELNTSLSGNIITTEVNNVTDTTLAVGNVTSSLSGTILTTSVNGVSDTAQLSGIIPATTNVLSYANPILTSTVNGVTDTALVSISGVADVDLDLVGNVMTSNVDGVSDTSLVIGEVNALLSGNTITVEVNNVNDTTIIIGELNTNLSGNTLTTEVNNVTDTSLVIGSNVLSWNATDKILTSSVNGVSDTSFVTGLNGIYSGSGNIPDDTYSELLTSEEFAIGYFTDFPLSLTPSIDRGIWFKPGGTYIVGGDSMNTVRQELLVGTDGINIWSDSVSMESRFIANKDSLINRVIYVASNEGSRVGMWGDSMKLQQDFNTLTLQGASIVLNDHGGTGRGTSGQVWHSNGTSGYWDNVSGGATTNTLSLSGNTMTSNVDGVIDTSLVIGSHVISWDSTNKILTSAVNGISDTTKITVAGGSVSANTLTWNGANTMTSTVEGITDTSWINRFDSIGINYLLNLTGSYIKDYTGAYPSEGYALMGIGSLLAAWKDPNLKTTDVTSTITSDQDDYNVSGGDVIAVSGDATMRAITSLSSSGLSSGHIKTIVNIGSYPLYFPSNHPDAGAANEIEYVEDVILMPKQSIQFMWLDNSSDDYWIPLNYTSPSDGKIVELEKIAGTITAGDNDLLGFAVSSGTSGNQGPISYSPHFHYSLSTGAGATNTSTIIIHKSIEEFCYLSSQHISGQWLLTIPDLSTGSDSFDVFCQFLENATPGTSNPNNNWGFRYSHGAYGGNWVGFSKSNAGATTSVDLGVTVAADTPYLLRCEVDKARSEIRYYINGEYTGRVTANIANASVYGMRAGIYKGVGTTPRSLWVAKMGYRTVTP